MREFLWDSLSEQVGEIYRDSLTFAAWIAKIASNQLLIEAGSHFIVLFLSLQMQSCYPYDHMEAHVGYYNFKNPISHMRNIIQQSGLDYDQSLTQLVKPRSLVKSRAKLAQLHHRSFLTQACHSYRSPKPTLLP